MSPYRYTAQASTSSASDTEALGFALGCCLRLGDVVSLNGDLGAGKTVFTKGVARALGIEAPITSPTFTLANQYQGSSMLHHLDVYRLAGPEEAYDLALDELYESGVTIVEWGDIIAEELPPDAMRIDLRIELEPVVPPGGGGPAQPVDDPNQAWEDLDSGRRIDLIGIGPRWENRAAELDSALAPWRNEGGPGSPGEASC